jgi:hypothetical protein
MSPHFASRSLTNIKLAKQGTWANLTDQLISCADRFDLSPSRNNVDVMLSNEPTNAMPCYACLDRYSVLFCCSLKCTWLFCFECTRVCFVALPFNKFNPTSVIALVGYVVPNTMGLKLFMVIGRCALSNLSFMRSGLQQICIDL